MTFKIILVLIFIVLMVNMLFSSKNDKDLLPKYIEKNITSEEVNFLDKDELEIVIEENITEPEEKLIIEEPLLVLSDFRVRAKKLRKKMRRENNITQRRLLRLELVKLKKQRNSLRFEERRSRNGSYRHN